MNNTFNFRECPMCKICDFTVVDYKKCIQKKPDDGSSIKSKLLQTIADFLAWDHNDTVWIGDAETMLDRLATLYLDSGGTQDELAARWPEYFGEVE